MSESTQEIEVIIEGAETTTPLPETPKKISADEGIEDLKRQLETERAQVAAARAAAEAAEARAATAQQSSVRFQTEAQQARYDAVSRALEGTTAALAAAKADYAAAMGEADYARAAEASAAISKAAARQGALEEGKAQMEAMRAAPPPRQAPPVQPPQSQFTPRTQKWLNDHPEVLSDPVKTAEVTLAHARAVAAGYVPDSDAYFDFVETQAGYKTAAPTRQNQRQPAPSAPPQQSGRAPSGRHAVPTKLVMTPRMQEAARTAGVSHQEWAKHYLRELEAGTIEPLH